MIKVAFIFKFQGNETKSFSPKGSDGSIDLRYESLITVDYKYKEILLFTFLDVKLCLREAIIKF